jgi:hypothetical protein
MPTQTIGEGKSEYVFQHRDRPDEKIIVRQNDDERLNEAGNEIEAEDKVNAFFGGERRGEFQFESKKLASIVQEDARAEQKLEDVS